jgi:hypothetical protein
VLDVVGADISPLLAALVLVAVFEVASWLVSKNHVAWENRGFEKLMGRWRQVHWFSVGIGVVAALGAYAFTQNPIIFMIMGIVGYVLGFSGWVDLVTFRAPVEILHLGLYSLAPIMIFGLLAPGLVPEREPLFLTNDPLIQLGFAAALPVILFILAYVTGGMGLSDVRAYWVVAFAFGWWLGIGTLINLMLVSAGLQIIANVLGMIFNWGEMVQTTLGKKKRRGVPWLPMIGLAFVAGPVVVLALS